MNPTKRLQEAAGLSQRACAKLAGISQPLWCNWANKGELLDLRFKTIQTIARVFGLNYVGILMERLKMDKRNNKENNDG